ncbi:c-type cytochrome biogenesis protein CcmI [Endozoicomonas gorgoniicola]|uniref:C-type cytochrome biogenesis protein CcmI n=1 Tax=Endozoicomonas gorgoniicola TaxID=1234144 RepID=A0ABT3MYT4_9GAMM|nr:c-type cytochrome biogenesis protein CcmI [Endozoicomonas gorgoniicola]MCW7554159.1 c-type cytochrome biogenesis protein CcmI [Endozoicomonas gorgoniicola]
MNFWFSAGLLIMAAIALAAVPLLVKRRKSSGTSAREANIEQFREQQKELEAQLSQGLIAPALANEMRAELEKKLLSDVPAGHRKGFDVRPGVVMSALIVLLIPLMALPLYWKLGAQTELQVAEALAKPELNSNSLLETLESWQQKKPDNPQALYLLGGRYLALGRMEDSVHAFRRFYQLTDSDQGAAQLAQVLYLKNNSQFDAEVSQLLHEALTRNEFNTTALGMQGIAAFGLKDYAGALAAWDKAFSVETDPEARESLLTGINQAKKMLGEPLPSLRVMVSLAPELQSLPGNTRVMVFARAAEGRMPLAVKPVLVSELPGEVVLDESTAMMMGGSKLSETELLDVVATISLSGDVMNPDYKGEVKSVRPESKEVVELLIEPAG